MCNGLRVLYFVCGVVLIGISVLGFEKPNPYDDLFNVNISSLEE
jgi:hypothetical protein